MKEHFYAIQADYSFTRCKKILDRRSEIFLFSFFQLLKLYFYAYLLQRRLPAKLNQGRKPPCDVAEGAGLAKGFSSLAFPLLASRGIMLRAQY